MRLFSPRSVVPALFLLPLIGAASTNNRIVPQCIDLDQDFLGMVSFPQSPGYSAASKSYYTAFEQEVRPDCYVRPNNSRDVSKVITNLKGTNPPVRLAIKGGGHAIWAGAANIEHGVTLDLSGLTGVTVDPGTKIASIGAGERWQSVYEKLGAQGLAVTGGRVASVGVSGLTLGGGLSFFGSAEGFVCDHVLNFEVVLASGRIVQANAMTNSDLFQALKGGSNNFGVVTRLDVVTFPQGQLWGGAIFYNASVFPQLVRAFSDFALGPADDAAHTYIAAAYSNGTEIAASEVIRTDGKANPPSLAPLASIQPQVLNTLRKDSLANFTKEISSFNTPNTRMLWFTTSIRPDQQLLNDVHDIWSKALEHAKSIKGLLSFTLVYQIVTKNMLINSHAKGGNSLGLMPDDGPFIIVEVNSEHKDAADDATFIELDKSVLAEIDKLAARRNKSVRFRYLNYAYKDQHVIESYGTDSVKALQAVSKSYDPDGFFQQNVPGGFKLPVMHN